MSTRLSIINAMLRITGEFAVDSTLDNHPDVVTASALLDDERKDFLGEGFWFNTHTLDLFPDVNGFIYVPDGTLALDATDINVDVSIRGNRLFDNNNNTFVFTGKVEVEIIKDMVEDEIPPLAVSVIRYNSVLTFAADNQITGEPIRNAENKLAQALLRFNSEKYRKADVNFSNNKLNQRMQAFKRHYSTDRRSTFRNHRISKVKKY